MKSVRCFWVSREYCTEHGFVNCDCRKKGQQHSLFIRSEIKDDEELSLHQGTAKIIQYENGMPFYGSWESGAPGFTGRQLSLSDAKEIVETEVLKLVPAIKKEARPR